jgi:hypothetical protein
VSKLVWQGIWEMHPTKNEKKIFVNGFYASICDTIITLLALIF